MINRLPLIALAAMTLFAMAPGAALAVMLGQSDDFEDGTTQDWRIGGSGTNPPFNVATGGPSGAGDNFLQYNSDGAGDSGRMNFFNVAQWSGDYLTAGVTAITADVYNLSSSETLNLRLALGTSTSANAGSWFASTSGITLAPGSGWTSVSFSLDQADLTSVVGAGSYNDVLSSVVTLRILSSDLPGNRGDRVVASLGADNITAVPEPAALALLAAGTLLALRRRR